MEIDYTSVAETLKWLVGGGAITRVPWFVSRYLEKIAAFQKISSEGKELIILLLAVLLGVGAAYLLNMPAETFEKIVPYVGVVFATVVAWLAFVSSHARDPQR